MFLIYKPESFAFGFLNVICIFQKAVIACKSVLMALFHLSKIRSKGDVFCYILI
ncbi:hypothetical protein SAMN05444397_10994 [Flavobacterium aquidurense]|nr:hypothetical protein SAMN05444397_10994 [Flavobacterium aquidurense]